MDEKIQGFERRTNNPPLQMREALSGGFGGFLCQVGIEKPYLTSCEAACVHEEVAKADSECPLYMVDVEKEESMETCPHCTKHKERSQKEYRDLLNRLSRVEGQIRGIRRMVEDDCYCTDILVQVSAATAALNSFNKVLLGNHIKTCVAQDIRDGKEETVDELVNILQKLMK